MGTLDVLDARLARLGNVTTRQLSTMGSALDARRSWAAGSSAACWTLTGWVAQPVTPRTATPATPRRRLRANMCWSLLLKLFVATRALLSPSCRGTCPDVLLNEHSFSSCVFRKYHEFSLGPSRGSPPLSSSLPISSLHKTAAPAATHLRSCGHCPTPVWRRIASASVRCSV